MESIAPSILAAREYDIAIVGAGPVGLAMAIELSRLGLSVVVLDRRPPLDEDARARPQLLVARSGDLAHLAQLGVDIRDETLVSLLAVRSERDLASGTVITGEVLGLPDWFSRAPNLWALAAQPPVALVPIARLQQALLDLAIAAGAEVRYGCEVTRLRRHARFVSLACTDRSSARAAIAILATGAARPLIASLLRDATISTSPAQQLIAGVFAIGGDRGRWLRVELPVRGHTRALRCTLLQTPSESGAGTAVLVDPQLDGTPSDDQLHGCFAAAARELGMTDAPYLFQPQVFTSAVTEVSRRFIGGDGRAPVVIAGDAAQTGHVFSGQTCFVNVALALELCEQLRKAKQALVERDLHALGGAFARYAGESEIGAAILARASQRHLTRHAPGAWALAGIARAR